MLSAQFINPKYESIYFGSDCLEKSLQAIIVNNKLNNIFLVSTSSLVNSSIFSKIKNIIQNNYAGEFTQTHMHSPITVVKQLAEKIKQANAQLVISLGGGSVIDSVKAALILLDPINTLAHLAIPTTLSGAEFTWYFATTDQGVKTVNNNSKAAPRWIILDPDVTQNTPLELWSSTGIKTLADCIEVLSSKQTNFFAESAATQGLKLLHEHLINSCDVTNAVARNYVQLAPAYALSALLNAGGGLITALRHQLGARFNISHGLASAIIMPYVLQWNYSEAKAVYTKIANLIHLNTADEFLKYIEQLLVQCKLNKKLHELIADKKEFNDIAEQVLQSPLLGNNPKSVTSKQDIMTILENAW